MFQTPQLLPNDRELAARRSGVIAKVCKLPPFAPAALRLLAISTDSLSAVDDFEAAFRLDPALTANLLTTANSPLFAFRAHIGSIRRAISLLGLEAVRALAVTIGLRTYISRAGTQEAVRDVWGHGVAAAVIAEALGRHGNADPSTMYTAGLLHDIGRLALLSTEGTRYSEILARHHYDMEESLLLETLTCGCTHDDVGAFLCRSWGFPEALCDCVRFHHQPVAEHAGPPLELVHMACRMADVLDIGEVRYARRSANTIADLLPENLARHSDFETEALRERITQMTNI